MTTSADDREARLRARIEHYGAALEQAAEADAARPAPTRHLIVVDGPVGRPARRRPSWRGPVGRAAAVVVVLAALAGTTWAATRPTQPSVTSAGQVWADDDIVRPEDRPAALAALAGTWPLPPNGSLDFVLDRRIDAPISFAAFRSTVAHDASCLWFRYAVEEPDLTADEREIVAAIPTWPGNADAGGDDRTAEVELVAAALAGDRARLREQVTASCAGSSEGLGLPEIGGHWLIAGNPSSSDGAPVDPGGSATAVDPTQVRGWDAIVARLGPEVRVDGAVALPDGTSNVRLTVSDTTFSLTIGVLGAPVTLPVTQAELERGSETRDGGIEVFAGPVGDDASLVQAVGPDGDSVALSFGSPPDEVERAVGDLADLAADLHAAVWPR
ncbi:MAG TPA: hypothetical protein VGO60_10875 [Iamia sp.]|jgi:hypothetical protein|nr:hypothetical protein [Iamia sp.]